MGNLRRGKGERKKGERVRKKKYFSPCSLHSPTPPFPHSPTHHF